MARLYLDEHLSDRQSILSAAGHDVIVASEHPRASRSDAWHFREALRDDRIIITLNRSDFLYLHQLWTTLCTLGTASGHHHGILTAMQSGLWNREDWTSAIMDKLNDSEPLTGRMSAWLRTSSQGLWRWEQWRAEQD